MKITIEDDSGTIQVASHNEANVYSVKSILQNVFKKRKFFFSFLPSHFINGRPKVAIKFFFFFFVPSFIQSGLMRFLARFETDPRKTIHLFFFLPEWFKEYKAKPTQISEFTTLEWDKRQPESLRYRFNRALVGGKESRFV